MYLGVNVCSLGPEYVSVCVCACVCVHMFLCASVHCGSVYEFVCVFAGVCGHAQW